MPFEVLSPHGQEGARWRALVDALPKWRRDIHFRPEYAAVQEMLGAPTRLAALINHGGDFVIQPFVTRTTVDLPGDPIDVTSPYGYGGPLASASDDSTASDFVVAFSTWCRDNRVVDEYCVLHPFVETHQQWIMRDAAHAHRKKSVVVMALKSGFDDQYRRDRRAGIARAKAAGVTVERVDPSPEKVATFCRLYRETMLRKRASERWYFPEEYLRAHFDMGPDLASLFFARVDGEVEVASLVLHAHSTAYYHLTGNRMANPKIGANDLLVHEVAAWAMDAGYDHLHLGGGLTSAPNDSLLEYKAGFSKYRAPVYSYFRVFDDARYNELCAAKRAQEIATLGREIVSDFVPAYRREAA